MKLLLVFLLMCGSLREPRLQDVPTGLTGVEFAWLAEVGRASTEAEAASLILTRTRSQLTDLIERSGKALQARSPKVSQSWLPAGRGIARVGKHLGEPWALAKAHSVLGKLLLDSNQFKEGEAAYQEALAAADAGGLKQEAATACVGISNCLIHLGNPQAALTHGQRAAAIAREQKNSFVGARALHSMSLAHLLAEDFRAARKCLEGALVEARNVNDFRLENTIKCQLASVLVDLQEVESARFLLAEAEKYFSAAEDNLGVAQSASEQGNLEYSMGRHDIAVAHFRTARDLYLALGDDLHVAKTDINLANAVSDMGHLEQAVQWYQRAKASFEKLGARVDVGHALLNEGIVQDDLGKPSDALELLDKAIIEFSSAGPGSKNLMRSLGRCQLSRGVALRKLKRLEDAKLAYQRAIELFREVGSPGDEGSAQMNLGNVFLDEAPDENPQPFLEKAEAQYKIALPLFKSAQDSNRTILCLCNLGNVQFAQRKFRDCSESYRSAAVSLNEALAKSRDPLFAAALADAFATAPSAMALAYFAQGKHAEGFDAVQLCKGAVLRSSVNQDSIGNATLPPKMASDLRQARARFQATSLELSRHPQDVAVVESYRKAEENYIVLESSARGAHPRFNALVGGPVSRGDLERLLKRETAIVEIVTEFSQTLLYVVRHIDGKLVVRSRHVALDQRILEEEQKSFDELMRRPSVEPDGIASSAKKMYKWLIAPILRDLTGIKRLVICPDRWTQGVPFSALRDENGPYLIETFAITLAPSASAWHALRSAAMAKGDRPPGPVLAVAVSDFQGRTLPALAMRGGPPSLTLPRLSEAPIECKRVLELVNGSSLVNQQATVRRIQDEAPKADILHFASHAGTSAVSPLYSYLMVQPEVSSRDPGVLFARDIYDLRLRARLAVLSACDTLGDASSNEGMLGMSWAFLVAGCPSVVATRWRLNSAAAVPWVKSFYSGLAKGMTIGDSYQKACLNLLRSKSFSDPAKWAAWTLVGTDE